jgi:outer membrane lipoprotein carrier protein
MNHTKTTLALFFAASALLSAAVPSGAITAGDILQKVEERYESLTDFRAGFQQALHLDEADTAGHLASGILWVKKPAKFRLELEHQTTVSDGRTLWTYVPDNNQVLVDAADPTGGGIRPDQLFLTYFQDADAILCGTEQVAGLDCYHLCLQPAEEAAIASLQVWVDKDSWLARRLTFIDEGGMITHYRFTEMQINPGLPDSLFVFQAPDTVEVIDMRW